MREIIGMALALAVLKVDGENLLSSGNCAERKCFAVQTGRASFDAAQRVCQGRGGHLMTVRNAKSAEVLSKLLTGTSGNFWLGLKHQCPSDGLKGYKWVTGDDASLYTNWESERAACSPRCASVSQKVQKWAERPCDDILDGYLCEYDNLGYCQPLSNDSAVVYETPFGFNANELLREIPQGTNATLQPLRTRHICFEGVWLQAPWSCEVFDGGCEYKCVDHACICQSGFKLDRNRVSCSKADEPEPLTEAAKSESDECAPGFGRKSGVCADLDECESAPCEHDCINTEGSYRCECYEGYIQSKKDVRKCERHCADFECEPECDPNNNFQCNCPYGFIFDEDTQKCVDIDECGDNFCDQECKNTAGGFICSCREGFVLVEDVTCVEDSEGSGGSTPFDSFKPTSRSPTDKPMSISSGSLLAIMVCIVACILLLVCLAHCALRRFCQMHNYDVHKGQDEIYNFQQVITDKNSTELSLPNRYFKRDT